MNNSSYSTDELARNGHEAKFGDLKGYKLTLNFGLALASPFFFAPFAVKSLLLVAALPHLELRLVP